MASPSLAAPLIHFLAGLALVLAAGPPCGGPLPAARAQVIRLRQPLLRERLQNIFATSANDGPVARPSHETRPLPAPVPIQPEAESRGAPGSVSAPSNLIPAAAEPTQPPTARPGNILVHLGPDQEIDRLEYMLKGGRLATVYQRHRDTPPPPPPPAEPNGKRQEIQYGPSNANIMSSLGGPGDEPRPLVLPPFHGEPIQVQAQPGGSVATIDFEDDEHLDQGHDLTELVGPATPIGAAGLLPPPPAAVKPAAVGKLAKAKGFIKKIKGKFKKLPKMIQKKLAAKSTVGKMFLDGAGGQRVPLGQNHGHRFSWSMVNAGDHAHSGLGLGVSDPDGHGQPQVVPPPPLPGTEVGAVVLSPGAQAHSASSNVVRLETQPSGGSASAESFGAGLSRHDLRAE